MNTPLYIPILLGTTRQGRKSEHVARYIQSVIEARDDMTCDLFDPRDMNLPMDTEGQKLKFKNPEYRNAIMRADALVIVSPEYNHGYSGSLKRALDVLLKEYIHRAVGLVGVSSGGFGGARAIEQLVGVVRELGLVVSSTDVSVSRVGDVFDDAGNLRDESLHERIEPFLDDLKWIATSLRWGRENVPSRFDEQIQSLQKEWDERMGS